MTKGKNSKIAIIASFICAAWMLSQAAEGAGQSGKNPGNPGTPYRPIYDLFGYIAKVSPAEKMVVVQKQNVYLTENTYISLGRKEGSFLDLKRGTWVGIIGRKTPRGFTAENVDIRPGPPPRQR